MRVRSIVASLVAAATIAVLGVAAASPASATTYYIDACQDGTYTVLDGDTVYVFFLDANGGGADICKRLVGLEAVAEADYSVPPDYCFSFTFGPATRLFGLGLLITTDSVATLGSAVTALGCGITPPAEDTSIPAWVQAYGRAKDATCRDGWSASWQEWAQEVTGGWVCTRSIPSLG